ncbi:MAG TPA: 16S rRNA (cytosine(1402)-N(4))-methyltransferase RsmH [Blastocatellia bacterium]|nr:16S rRNA (cytosine(1402)-N(4))-methyltransferase RsmH [Blastocatellia bacterium]
MDANVGEKEDLHEPVLLAEVVEWLRPAEGGTFVDCTVGLGGHAWGILTASPHSRVIGIDRDLEALALARERLSIFEDRVQLFHANFESLDTLLAREGITEARGILADLGVSSLQLERSERGFSFASDAPLDMRMDQSGGRTAAVLLNELAERELADLIFEYGEERGARKIARAVVRQRDNEPLTTTKQLADIVVRSLNVPGRWRIHPATRTFQALRIAVNEELRALEVFIPAAISRLARGGRLAIISFHSLEDRIVKRGFLRESGRCTCQHRWQPGAGRKEAAVGEVLCEYCGASKRVSILTRKPVRPAPAEMERNPRSRSSLLRVCERL